MRLGFCEEYKRRNLEEGDRCWRRGVVRGLLGREGLYSSHLSTWRRQRQTGILHALAPQKRGRKSKPKNPLAEENERLRRENARLAVRLKQAEAIIEVQKSSPAFWGSVSSSADRMDSRARRHSASRI